ncbi:MAG: GIY-YIG nuclease family protein, partial [Bacteroidales bacterium]|nr:GIY-YIG nuclease family protein [Bacteroidales bacterium]
MNFSPDILSKVNDMPLSPGVYQYYDKDGKMIYVGKAKSLRKRVSSYFRNDVVGKTAVLVKRIADISFVVVENEHDALLLENSLIKKNQPKYNISLKDDKTYPWICIKNEPFPRIFKTRNLVKDGSQYFGPYSSVYVANTILSFIKDLYKLRTCKLNLSPDNIKKGKFKICLESHIGNCNAPCVSRETEEAYLNNIVDIRKILKGNVNDVKVYFKDLMNDHAENLEFEEAENVRSKIKAIEDYQSKSKVMSNTIGNVDVFGYLSDEKEAFVNFFKVVNGSIVQFHTVEIKLKV